ncbi:MAG: GNAT family N-acetyltransferase [Candidatus Woesearchaeota archaeon]
MGISEMKSMFAMPSEYPIERINDTESFDNTGLEGLMDAFPYSSRRDYKRMKNRIVKGELLLWAAFHKDSPVGYVLCEPKHYHDNILPGYGFYFTERFVEKSHRGMLLCSRLVGVASSRAREMRRKCIFEEVDASNMEGILSSESLGFEEFSTVKRGNKTYSMRRKYLARQV